VPKAPSPIALTAEILTVPPSHVSKFRIPFTAVLNAFPLVIDLKAANESACVLILYPVIADPPLLEGAENEM
jgi:hypothetical protein